MDDCRRLGISGLALTVSIKSCRLLSITLSFKYTSVKNLPLCNRECTCISIHHVDDPDDPVLVTMETVIWNIVWAKCTIFNESDQPIVAR